MYAVNGAESWRLAQMKPKVRNKTNAAEAMVVLT
jgi:hypothetical protein